MKSGNASMTSRRIEQGKSALYNDAGFMLGWFLIWLLNALYHAWFNIMELTYIPRSVGSLLYVSMLVLITFGGLLATMRRFSSFGKTTKILIVSFAVLSFAWILPLLIELIRRTIRFYM